MATDPKLNILLITADQWRGDTIGYAGHAVVKTPHLDRLAAEGVAFLRHYASAAPCSPARACLYTGLYQMNNRVVRNGSPLDRRFDNLALAARRAGIHRQVLPRIHDPRRQRVAAKLDLVPVGLELHVVADADRGDDDDPDPA